MTKWLSLVPVMDSNILPTDDNCETSLSFDSAHSSQPRVYNWITWYFTNSSRFNVHFLASSITFSIHKLKSVKYTSSKSLRIKSTATFIVRCKKFLRDLLIASSGLGMDSLNSLLMSHAKSSRDISLNNEFMVPFTLTFNDDIIKITSNSWEWSSMISEFARRCLFARVDNAGSLPSCNNSSNFNSTSWLTVVSVRTLMNLLQCVTNSGI